MTTKSKLKSAKKGYFSGMEKYLNLIAPIMSMSILVLGMGALTTFTTLRLDDFKTVDWLIGLISASYFVGLTAGGYKAQHLILRVGHIRSYAVFSALFAVSSMLQGLFELPWTWIPLRFMCGFSLAGCFLVVESWLLGASTRKNRGVILAIYMISYYAGQSIGQFFLIIPNIEPLQVYLLVSMFLTLSILPVATTRFHAPYAEEPNILSFKKLNEKAPVAIWGALGAGFTLASIYSLYPLYLSYTDWQQYQVSLLMSALLFGATISQYPIGWLSDKFDRRLVLILMLVLCFVVLIIIGLDHSSFGRLCLYTIFLGSATFTIYPISINHGVDHFTSKDLISATAAIMLAYGIGSSFGPTVVSMTMHVVGVNGFIYVLSVLSLILSAYVAYMVMRYETIPLEDQTQYTPVPDTTVEVMQMDPEVREKDIRARHVESIEN